MKIHISTVLACFPLSAILIWTAAAQADLETGGGDGPTSGPDSEVQARLEQAASEIRTRLHRPAMLEVSDNPADEAEIAELYHSGWIIDATVDEVEAALQAAEATPEPEDNVAALILAHRASCRYFLEE
ncbi:hypothetical protein JIN84_00345 [Luteolibacter yonseiensis]|uniref:DUF732 domain-containing protein n=1 Tax=Luteolibacter yonseiensis TaxID=1144680 RepID=A0A934V9R1_9BACT|nr:hypothetical protein [Luteolibacter yonseiensis]MBK1814056.1 hypothetical protein [Luteolibacter yonseiensis]